MIFSGPMPLPTRAGTGVTHPETLDRSRRCRRRCLASAAPHTQQGSTGTSLCVFASGICKSIQAVIDAMRALQAIESGDHVRVVVVELDFVELLHAEPYGAVLTLVRPEVARTDPPFSAILAYQCHLYCATSIVLALMSRPVGGVIRFQAFGATKGCLAGFAD